MKIRTADARVSDFDIHISIVPVLWLVRLPFHIALGSRRVEAHPALKLVVGTHDCVRGLVYELRCVVVCNRVGDVVMPIQGKLH